METEQPESSLGSFCPELTESGYTSSFISSPESPPSPITSTENALLDTSASETLGQDQSKAPGAGRLEGSPSKLDMTLQKRKQP